MSASTSALSSCCTGLKSSAVKKAYNYPFLMGQGVWIDSEKLDRYDSVAEVLKHGTLSVGFIGLAETLVALTGKHHARVRKATSWATKSSPTCASAWTTSPRRRA